ncbi:MAG: hypothetical protein IPH20_13520 [Bacteroidales bacterium]|nr:hypothetical protein [Bacteroidales bacterium]
MLELKAKLKRIEKAKKILDADIRNDETGKQIQELAKDIKSKSSEKTKRFEKLTKYNKAATKINFEENPNEESFSGQIIKANKRTSEIEEELKDKEFGIQKNYDYLKLKRKLLNYYM